MNKTIACVISGALLLGAGAAQADKGQDVYNSKCVACHATGVAGAPKFGDKAAWGPRIEKGMDALMATVMSGKGAMPPKGTCMDCSEADLKATVEYMVNAAQ